MATPRAGDNRVAPTQMDGRHVHNKHPARCTFTFVKRAAALWRWMGSRQARGYLAEKPATWTFRLRVGRLARFQGFTSITQTWIKIMAGWLDGKDVNKACLVTTVVHWDFWFCKWEDEHLYLKEV